MITMEDINFAKPRLHFFVCVNDRTTGLGNEKSSCGPMIKPEDVKEVKQWIRSQGLGAEVYCTMVRCLGFCNPEGGVMCVYPSGRFVKGLQGVEDIKKVILEEVARINQKL